MRVALSPKLHSFKTRPRLAPSWLLANLAKVEPQFVFQQTKTFIIDLDVCETRKYLASYLLAQAVLQEIGWLLEEVVTQAVKSLVSSC